MLFRERKSGGRENRAEMTVDCIYTYVCVCVCVYIYIYIYTHTHTHTVRQIKPFYV